MAQEINGLLNISKPCGVTSYYVVKNIKRVLKAKKVGHCGTLDPLAEGVLLIVLGKATKLQESLMALKKTYRAKILLGVSTDTGDITGKVESQKDCSLITLCDIERVLKGFVGEIEQIPPMYSALKHKGERLYVLARKGINVERKPRIVNIYNIEVFDYKEYVLDVEIECSKGTYVRSLAMDLGDALGCGATVKCLTRSKVGPFSIESAIEGKNIKDISDIELFKRIYPLDAITNIMAY